MYTIKPDILKVLFLEDSNFDFEIIKNMIESEFKLDFTHAINSETFIEALQNKGPFDIVLSDFSLPSFDAFAALEMTQNTYPSTPFIVVSGTIGEDKAVDLLKKGATDYVLKDRLTRLIPSVRRALKEAREEKKLAEAQANLRKQNQELLLAVEKAEESDRLKTSFLANLSHEIRTPMNSIMGFSALLEDEDDQDLKLKYIEIIQRASSQLLNIINSIIDISKIEANKLTLKPKTIYVNEVLKYQQATFEKLASTKKLKLTARLLPTATTIYADETKLNQVLSNLIDNALKFTKKGEVSFGVQQRDSLFEFFIEDTGIGISDEDKVFIFDRFRQVDDTKTRKYGGLGVGLSISKSYIEAMGGEIILKSQVGKGTRVSCILPSVQQE
ncbi:ATP-binding protein [Saccharicrinis sp. FJH54]|uniref:ATP-binding response regulator n=1 Tax=Saccharicrinis sp. FJH54 TaxID=3344665 RepID=UPI0035D5087B